MKIIGITGKSGSGKTTFASLLAQKLNCQYIDVDKIGHEALYRPEILNVLCEKFGIEILDDNGKVNRKKVGDIVFSDKGKMEILTDLTWSYMRKILDNLLLQEDEIIILDWALLPKTDYYDKCYFKILVKSDDIVRKNKVIERDKISEEYFNKRDSASIDYSLFKFDYIFENDYQLKDTENIIEELKERIKKF